jgi:hypothetical protein
VFERRIPREWAQGSTQADESRRDAHKGDRTSPASPLAYGNDLPWPSRILLRLLNPHKPLDYLWLATFAALPLVVAAGIGALKTTGDGFVGYGTRLNWVFLVVILPLSVFMMRRIANKIGSVLSPEPTQPLPPVVGLIETDAGRRTAYTAFRRALLAPKNLFAAFLVTFVIHVVDLAQLGAFFLSQASQVCQPSDETNVGACAREVQRPGRMQRLQVSFAGLEPEVLKDWWVAYLSSDPRAPGKWPNLALNVSAYAVQFSVVFVGVLITVIVFRHNMFFLTRVYQRRRVTPDEVASYIHIDLDDKEKCFGFRSANSAFNVQVLGLAIAAVLILDTRFANVGPPPIGVFPDPGQWLAVLTWLVALAIVTLPILVKLLPRLPIPAVGRAPPTLVDYLREFLSDEAWTVSDDTSSEEVDAVAARFAENAFWPTGNNRAWQLYFLSFWVFFVALVPDPAAIVGVLPPWWRIIGWMVAGVLAWVATWALFGLLRAMLTFVDPRLVEQKGRPTLESVLLHRRRKIPISVFISYRREDTAAYTGRLYDSLSGHFDTGRLFMDLNDIPGGADFMGTITSAIDSADALIVVIGPKWLTIAKRNGQPRIEDQSDFVHREVAIGLERGLRMFPVLVGRATMPSNADLPEGLRELADHNALEISDTRWAHDVSVLVKALRAVSRANRTRLWRSVLVADR